MAKPVEAVALINKYRPKDFSEVIGQDAVIRSLEANIKKRGSHAFLFTGPSGCGKTTVARITAKQLGCRSEDLMEIDAATYTGIDSVRGIIEKLAYRPLGLGNVKAIVMDEAHALSKSAWQALLKSIEEPPEHVFWMLCTTEPNKVPKAIQTRCFQADLKPVSRKAIEELLADVADDEKLDVDDAVLRLCAKSADGSPRQALANLSLCAVAKDVQEAAELLRSAEESVEAVELARLLVKGTDWDQCRELLSKMTGMDAESVRRVVTAYVTKVALNSPNPESAFAVLDAFSEPFYNSTGISAVALAVGHVVLGE